MGVSQVVFGESYIGHLSPDSEINFAVPSLDILRNFSPYSNSENSERPQGMLIDAMCSLVETLKARIKLTVQVILIFSGMKKGCRSKRNIKNQVNRIDDAVRIY